MSRARIAAGRRAEAFAARLLERHGVRAVERNVRVRYTEAGVAGEIDIIALDGRTLVFVEVKAVRTGAGRGPERPALAVTKRKQIRVRRLARARLASPPPLPRFGSVRFDVVGITLGGDGRPIAWEWIRNAF